MLQHKSTYPSTTSSVEKVFSGDLALVARFVELGVTPRFGDVFALFPAAVGLPPFFFCRNKTEIGDTAC